jgi:hypothetical protein
MLNCPVCQTENDMYATVCTKCGSFLQNRIPNLDLFYIAWKVLESPRKAFHLITLAEHKNYVLFLYTLAGIAAAFAGFWYFTLGEVIGNILVLIFFALLIGIPLGLILCPVASLVHLVMVKILGKNVSFRISLGTTGYALVPIIISLLFVKPIELLTFGLYFFSVNPPPIAIKPVSYVVLIGFDGVLLVWSFLLLIVGTKIGCQLSVWKSTLVSAVVYVLILFGLTIGFESAVRMF